MVSPFFSGPSVSQRSGLHPVQPVVRVSAEVLLWAREFKQRIIWVSKQSRDWQHHPSECQCVSAPSCQHPLKRYDHLWSCAAPLFPSNHTFPFVRLPLLSSFFSTDSERLTNERECDMKVTSSTTGVSFWDEARNSFACHSFSSPALHVPDGHADIVQSNYSVFTILKTFILHLKCQIWRRSLTEMWSFTTGLKSWIQVSVSAHAVAAGTLFSLSRPKLLNNCWMNCDEMCFRHPLRIKCECDDPLTFHLAPSSGQNFTTVVIINFLLFYLAWNRICVVARANWLNAVSYWVCSCFYFVALCFLCCGDGVDWDESSVITVF